jgi:glycosyltransferase involved in cell wall biosynthesis
MVEAAAGRSRALRRFLAPAPSAQVERAQAPTFSVLIAAYQAEQTIVEAALSALGQTEPPLEVIVCDDGSTDGTAEALAPYRDRIVYLHKENGGGASALNACLALSRGEFVHILDADDTLEPEALEALGELALLRPDLDILATDVYLVVGEQAVARLSDKTPFEIKDQKTAIFDRCFILHPAVRRTRLLEVGGFDESFRIVYDWDCWLRLLLLGSRAGIVAEPLYRYRVHGSSLSSNRVANLQERARLLEKALRQGAAHREERSALERALRLHRSRALVAETEEAIVARAAGRRRRSIRLALSRGRSPRTRLKAAAAVLFPGAAARRLESRDASGARSLRRPELDA